MSRDIDKDFRVPNSNKVYTCHSGSKIEKKCKGLNKHFFQNYFSNGSKGKRSLRPNPPASLTDS